MMSSLEDLLVEEIRDLYSTENQILKAIPRMANAATSPDLKAGFEEMLVEAHEHVARLEEICEELGESPRGKVCRGMQGLLEEGADFLWEEAPPSVRDAGILSAAQRVEHYEMAGYGTCCSHARQLGHAKAVGLLSKTLSEAKSIDQRLSELAARRINAEAAVGIARPA